MKRSRHLLTLSLLATGTALATPAAAATIVDTGAIVNTGGWSLGGGIALAGLFTLNSATTITSVEGMIGGTAATGTISIYSGGVDPGYSGLLFDANFAIANSRLSSYQGVFGQNWNLAAGSYWVGFSSDGSNFMAAPASNPLSQHAFLNPINNGLWIQQASLALGIRIIGNATVSPVPEPATWAMMLIGFGAIGGAMRARRRVSVSYG